MLKLGPGDFVTRAYESFALMTLGVAMVLLSSPGNVRRRRAGVGLSLLVVTIGGVGLLAQLADLGWFERLLFTDTHRAITGRTDFLTSVTLVLAGLTLALADVRPPKRLPFTGMLMATTFTVLMATLAIVFRVAYVRSIQIDRTQTIAIFVLVIGALGLRPESLPGRWVLSDDAGARLSRVMVPMGILVPVVISYVHVMVENERLFGNQDPIALATLGLVIFTLGFFAVAALRVSVSDRRWRRESDFLAALIESESDGILACDLEGRVIFTNPRFDAMYGMAVPAVLPDSNSDEQAFYTSDGTRRLDRDELPPILALRGELVQDKEFMIISEAGTRTPVSASSAVIRDDQDEVLGAVVALRDISLTREQERENRLLATAVEKSSDSVVLLDADGTVISWNDGAELAFGWTAGEMVGSSFRRLLVEPNGARAQAMFDLLKGGEALQPVEYDAVRKDGSRIVLDTRGFPIAGEDGEFLAAVVISRDISDKVERDRTNRLLASVVDSAADAFIVLTRDGTITHWSRGADEMLGRTREQMIGRPIMDLTAEPDRARNEAMLALLRDGLPMPSVEVEFVRDDGTAIMLDLRGFPIWDGEGRLIAGVAVARDITEQIRVNRERAAAEGLFRRVFEDSPSGKLLVNPDMRIADVNEAFCEITGYAEDEVRGRPLESVLSVVPDASPIPIREVQTREIPVYRGEKQLLCSGGRDVWVALQMSLISAEDSEEDQLLAQVLDITDRKHFESRLRFQADHDELTGLYNRRRFEGELEREIAIVERYGMSAAVVMLDLDNFKEVNDALGHAAGDRVIAEVGNTLAGRVRDTDIIARLGGDEFGVILTHTNAESASRTAADLIDSVRSRLLLASDKPLHSVRISAGMTNFGPEDDIGVEDLMAEADVAMYAAKDAGRDRLSVYDRNAAARGEYSRRFTWIQRIRDALGRDQFVLHAQPIVPIGVGNATESRRAELLIRMLDADGDLIPPGGFLEIAERFDLIQHLDAWVVRQSIALLAEEQAAGRDTVFEVNLSAKSVIRPETLDLIEAELEATGVEPDRLILEVTETTALINVEEAQRFTAELHKLGCRFALDDFGSGFSSFAYLRELDFDLVKIDGSYVKDLASSEMNQRIVKAVVEMARGLGKQTVAEFVGDAQTCELLRGYGVDYAQGFYIAKPGPIEALGQVPLAV